MQICTAHGVLQAAHVKRTGTGQNCKWYCILQIRTAYGVLPLDHAKRTDAVLDSAVAMLESGNSNAMTLLEPMMEQNEQASVVWSSCCRKASKHTDRLRHDLLGVLIGVPLRLLSLNVLLHFCWAVCHSKETPVNDTLCRTATPLLKTWHMAWYALPFRQL